MDDVIINLDTECGKAFGFTSDRFEGWLWLADGAVMVSFIVSKKKGNFRQLVEAIHQQGYDVCVPTPTGDMRRIVESNGYELSWPLDPVSGEAVELWTLPSPIRGN